MTTSTSPPREGVGSTPLYFCHIPKTAGTTLRRTLEGSFARHAIIPDSYMIARNGGLYPEIPIVRATVTENPKAVRLLTGHYHYDLRGILPGCRTIFVLRDPMARVISHIKHTVAHGGLSEDEVHRRLAEGSPIVVPNQMTRQLGGSLRSYDGDIQRHHERLMSGPIEDPDERLRSAVDAVRSADVVGFTEDMGRMAEDLKEIGIEFDPSVSMNSAKATIELSDDELALLRRKNELDIALHEKALEIRASR